LVAIDQIAPSSFGLPKRNHSWARQYQNLYMKAHRPTVAESGIHVSLISSILGQFCQNVDTINLDRQDYAFCAEFCGVMCGTFESEEARMTVANLLLEGYFSKPIQRLSGQSGQWRTGGSIVTVCGACSDLLAGVMHVQYKGDLCGGGAAPHEQNQAYYSSTVRIRTVEDRLPGSAGADRRTQYGHLSRRPRAGALLRSGVFPCCRCWS
jgi:uncharacterized protein YerC